MKHLMNAKVFVLLLLSLCMLSGATGTPNASGTRRFDTRQATRDKVSVRVKGRRAVVVNERGRSHTLDLSKHVAAARIEKASVFFLTRKGEFTYLLLDVCGLSKLPPDDRQCGAGIECNVVWLKLDQAWRVRDAKSELYESCWTPISSDEGPKVSGRRLTLVVDDLREEMRREVGYDADNPEEGLTLKQSAIPKTTP
jgi:hypothetical protein